MSRSNTGFSRRTFLSAGAAALAGFTLSRSLTLAAEESRAFGGLPLGVQSYTFRDRPFEKCLEAIGKDLKLSHVEIFPNHLAGISPSKTKDLLQAAGVMPTGYGVVPFSKKHDDNRKMFELAKTLGIKCLTCDPDPDAFDSLDKLTEEYQITADIHDHGPGHRWGKIDVIHDAIKDHSKMIGLCNDTGHFIRAGEDPLRACEVFKDRMHAMHVKDFKPKGDDWEDVTLGDGKLKLEPIVKWLLDNKFTGDLSLEYEGGKPVEACQESLRRFQNAVDAARKA